MKIGIIGTGVFSASIANCLAQNTENQITMWSENQSLVEEYKKTNKLESIFKDKVFPKNIVLTNSYEDVKDTEIIFIMTSINYIENVCNSLKDIIDKTIPICIGTKGVYGDKQKLVHELVKQILKNPIAILSGPTFAEDVMNLDPIAFNVACRGKKIKNTIQKAFDGANVKIEFTRDLVGIALCGSIKNVYAIGSGILEGLGYKESTSAYYLTAVMKELENILYMLDSDLDTLHSLAGFGDLIATCTSNKSRNYNLGVLLGKKKSKKEIESYKEKNTVEGVTTLENVQILLTKKHIKTPIITVLYKIVFEFEKPEALLEVMKDMKLNSIF